MTTKQKTVYLALNMDHYNSPYYPAVQAAVAAAYPPTEWELIEPRNQRWKDDEWLEKWPLIVADLSALVVWPRGDGTIGKGCWREITDAQERQIPVSIVDAEGVISPLGGILKADHRLQLPYYSHHGLVYRNVDDLAYDIDSDDLVTDVLGYPPSLPPDPALEVRPMPPLTPEQEMLEHRAVMSSWRPWQDAFGDGDSIDESMSGYAESILADREGNWAAIDAALREAGH